MAGHGSEPAENKAEHPGRKVGRTPQEAYDTAFRTGSPAQDRYAALSGLGPMEGPPRMIGAPEGRKVSNVVGTQPRAMPADKYRAQPNMVQRVRRERPEA